VQREMARSETMRSPLARSALVVAGTLFAVVSVAPVAMAAAAPDLGLAVSSTANGPLRVGDSFSYDVTVTNHGSAEAKGVVLEDDFPVGVEPGPALPVIAGGTCSIASSQQSGSPPHTSARCELPALAAGDAASVTIEVRITKDVTCGTITNTPSASARNEPSSATGDDQASVSDTVTCPPSLAVSLEAPRYAHVGASTSLSILVTNDGASDLARLRVVAPACSAPVSIVDDGDGDAAVQPGESWRYRCAVRITPATGRRVTATVLASARSSGTRVHGSDRTSVRVLRPALAVRVTPDPISGSPGEEITYRFVVRNVGDTAIVDIDVVDDRFGDVGRVSRLAPGHATTFSVKRQLRPDDVWVVDEATASGSDATGRRVTAGDRASVTIVAPTGATPADRRSRRGGTAFTGADATLPGSIAVCLAMIGLGALVASRRARA
jgi:uncharacterized repeat protein (TIGR01451 family)